ncbi:hypothetical protein ACPDI4_000181, partial [Campylobacter upsaliensis]
MVGLLIEMENQIGESIIGGTVTQDITNEGMIGQKIEVTQNSTIQNGITNKINGIDITNSQIGGNIV